MKSYLFYCILLVIGSIGMACDKGSSGQDTPISIHHYKNINLGNEFNTTHGSFINLQTGKVYNLKTAPKASEAQSNIDLVYWYVAAHPTSPMIGAPSMANSLGGGMAYQDNPDGVKYWTTVNNTLFDENRGRISIADFDKITNLSQLKAAFEKFGSLTTHEVEDAKSDMVYLFKTTNNKLGLMKINSIVGKYGVASTMNIDIKVQQ